IGVRDFAVVRALRTCAEFGRRVVGGVRIVEMDPYEERSSLLVAGCRGLLEPGEGGVDHGGCGPFRFETLGRPRIARDAIVVGDGSVSGTAVRAFVNRTPEPARRSSAGVTPAPRRSARNVSIVTSRTLGCGAARSTADLPHAAATAAAIVSRAAPAFIRSI